MSPHSVLGKRRNLLGYVEVTTLKRKWEANDVNPVSVAVLQCVIDSFFPGKHGTHKASCLLVGGGGNV